MNDRELPLHLRTVKLHDPETNKEVRIDRETGEPIKENNLFETVMEWIIFDTRYWLMAMYAMMSLVIRSYILHTMFDMARFCVTLWVDNSGAILTDILSIVDDMMIVSALFLITGGSNLVYVKKRVSDKVFRFSSFRPQAFFKLSPSELKEKMSASLAGVSAVLIIRLLAQIIDDNHISLITKTLLAVLIHLVLLTSLYVFAKTQSMEESEAGHAKPEHNLAAVPDDTEATHEAVPATPAGHGDPAAA